MNLGARRASGVVLGSGLGAVADAVEDPVVVGYEELPGFPAPERRRATPGRAVLGAIGGVPVAVSRAARTCTRAAIPRRCARRCARCSAAGAPRFWS